MKYSLPCSCGNLVPVEVGQAGQQVTCECGKQLEVPAMRAIRQLKPVPEAGIQGAAREQSWSASQRATFVTGLALAGIGFLVAGYFQLGRLRLNTEEVVWDTKLDDDLKRLESMNLQEAWGSWKKIRDEGIGPYVPPTYIQARMVAKQWWTIIVVALALGGAGMVLIGISFFLPGPQSPRSPRPKR